MEMNDLGVTSDEDFLNSKVPNWHIARDREHTGMA